MLDIVIFYVSEATSHLQTLVVETKQAAAAQTGIEILYTTVYHLFDNDKKNSYLTGVSSRYSYGYR
jgi:hypothetical protein